jgi:hypothetical protein
MKQPSKFIKIVILIEPKNIIRSLTLNLKLKLQILLWAKSDLLPEEGGASDHYCEPLNLFMLIVFSQKDSNFILYALLKRAL